MHKTTVKATAAGWAVAQVALIAAVSWWGITVADDSQEAGPGVTAGGTAITAGIAAVGLALALHAYLRPERWSRAALGAAAAAFILGTAVLGVILIGLPNMD